MSTLTCQLAADKRNTINARQAHLLLCVWSVFKRIMLLFREIKRRGCASLIYLSSAEKKAELLSRFWGVSVWTLACFLASSPKSVCKSFLSNWSDSNGAIYHRANLLQVKHIHWSCDSLENSPVSILPLLCFPLSLAFIFLILLDFFLHPSLHFLKVEAELEGVLQASNMSLLWDQCLFITLIHNPFCLLWYFFFFFFCFFGLWFILFGLTLFLL